MISLQPGRGGQAREPLPPLSLGHALHLVKGPVGGEWAELPFIQPQFRVEGSVDRNTQRVITAKIIGIVRQVHDAALRRDWNKLGLVIRKWGWRGDGMGHKQ